MQENDRHILHQQRERGIALKEHHAGQTVDNSLEGRHGNLRSRNFLQNVGIRRTVPL